MSESLITGMFKFSIDREAVEGRMDGANVICPPMLALECCRAIGVTTGKSVHDSH